MRKIVQIAAIAENDLGVTLYALDEEGCVWSYWDAAESIRCNMNSWVRLPSLPDDQENLKERA